MLAEEYPFPSQPVSPLSFLDGITKDSQVWFKDGNVIFVAQTPSMSFRVHKSILSRHSEVFQDLFSIPQPPTADTIEGCSVVHVSDTSFDFRQFLRVIYGMG